MHSLCGLIKTSVCAAALAALALPAHSDPAPGQGTWETTLQSRDGNHDGVVEAYYDTALNITWSRD